MADDSKKFMEECTLKFLKDAIILDAMEVLVNNQESIERYKLGFPLLKFAARMDAVKCAEFLLSKEGVLRSCRTHSWGYHPIHFAAVNGNYKTAKLLLDKGAKLEFTHRWGGDAIHTAVWYGQVEFIKKLMNSEEGKQAVKKSIQECWKDKKDTEEGTDLIAAVRHGKLEMAECLVELAEELQVDILSFRFSYNGYTALHEAAIRGHADVAEYLAEKRPILLIIKCKDIYTMGGLQLTPRQLAVYRGKDTVADALQKLEQENNLQSDVELDSHIQRIRYFKSWNNFKGYLQRLMDASSMFHPKTGAVGKKNTGAVPWTSTLPLPERQKTVVEKNTNKLRILLRQSIISLVAEFEQYILELFEEAADRARETEFKSRELINRMLQECKETEKRPNEDLKKHLVGTEFELIVEDEPGARCEAFYKYRCEAYFKKKKDEFRGKLSPKLEPFWHHLKELTCRDSSEISSYNFEKSGYCKIWTKIQDGEPLETRLTLTNEKAENTLSKFASLYYGMRCIFAHGSPGETLNNTLDQIKEFDAGEFGADEQSNIAVANYFNNLKKRVTDQRQELVIEYEDYVNCYKVYRFTAMLLFHSVMAGLDLWKSGEGVASDDPDDRDVSAAGDM